MALANDLMGLGLPPLLAQALGTDSNLTVTAAGTTFATATRLKNSQEVAVVSNATGTAAISLPAVGSDGALLAETFFIANTGTTSLQIFGSTGVTMTFNGSTGSQQPLQSGITALFFPVSSTSWIGMKGGA